LRKKLNMNDSEIQALLEDFDLELGMKTHTLKCDEQIEKNLNEGWFRDKKKNEEEEELDFKDLEVELELDLMLKEQMEYTANFGFV
jgi:hypothetical protein